RRQTGARVVDRACQQRPCARCSDRLLGRSPARGWRRAGPLDPGAAAGLTPCGWNIACGRRGCSIFPPAKGPSMAQVFKSIELVGVSPGGFDDAVRVAVKRASETMRGLRWLEVVDQRAYLKDGAVEEFQVTVRVWFELEDQ